MLFLFLLEAYLLIWYPVSSGDDQAFIEAYVYRLPIQVGEKKIYYNNHGIGKSKPSEAAQ